MVDDDNKFNNSSSKIKNVLSDSVSRNGKNNQSKSPKKELLNYNDILYQEEMVFNASIAVLQKSIRTVADTQILISYLKTLREFTNMLLSVSENYEDLLFNIASSLKYEKIPVDRVICKFGEKGKKFYIILKGKCTILLPKQDSVNLNQEDFYDYILRLKKYKEREILDKVLSHNKNTYPLEEDEFSWLRGEIDTLNGRINSSPFEMFLIKFAEEEGIEDINNLDFDIWRIFEKEFYTFNSQRYEQKILNIDEYIKNVYPISNLNKSKDGKEVVVWIYHNIISLKTGDKFGDMALSSSAQKRTASIISDLECHMGIMDKKTYIKCLKDVSDRAKRWNMNFVLSQKVFSSINPNIFHRNYFNNFVHKKLSRGDFLIKEGQEADKIFVVKDGQYEVRIKKANNELFNLIKKLGGKSGGLFQDFDLVHENKDFIQFMTDPKVAKIEIINETDIIGLDDIVLNNKYIFSIELTSIKGEIFELQRKFFNKMLKGNDEIQVNNNEFCIIKRNYWIERLRTIMESRVNFFKTYKEQKIFKEEEISKEQNQIIKAPNQNDLKFKNKINLNSTFCFCSPYSIKNSNPNSSENIKNSLGEKEKENKKKTKNKSFDTIINDISNKIYEKAMKQHPDYKRKARIEALRKLGKKETLKSNSALKTDLNDLKKPLSIHKNRTLNSNSTPNELINVETENLNFIWKNGLDKQDNCKLGRNTSNNFKTGLPNKDYYCSTERVLEEQEFSNNKNFFSFEKIYKNPHLLKKEILNNLLYIQSNPSDKILKTNIGNHKYSNSDVNDFHKIKNSKMNMNNYYNGENMNSKENSNSKNIESMSYNNFKNNSVTLNNVDENQKETQLTISVEKTNNNEKINDLMRETEPNNSLIKSNNSNFFITENIKKKKFENKKEFEAPIFAGINVTKVNFNVRAKNYSTNSKSKLGLITSVKSKINPSDIEKEKQKAKSNFETKENTVNKLVVVGKKEIDSNTKSLFNSFNNFNDASLTSLSKLKIKDKSLIIPIVESSGDYSYSSLDFKNKIKKVYNQNGKMIEFIAAQLPKKMLNQTGITTKNNSNNVTERDNSADGKIQNPKLNSENNDNFLYYKTLSLSSQAKNFSRNSNLNISKNGNNTIGSISAADNVERMSNNTNRKIYGSMSNSTENMGSLDEEEEEKNLINSNNSFEKKQIGLGNKNTYGGKNLKNNPISIKYDKEKSKSNYHELININDEYNFNEDKKIASYSKGFINNLSDKKGKNKILGKLVLRSSNSYLFNDSETNSLNYVNNHMDNSGSVANKETRNNLKIKFSNEEKNNKNIKSSFYNSRTDLLNYENLYNTQNKDPLNSSFYANENNLKGPNSSTSIEFYPRENLKSQLSLLNENKEKNKNNLNSIYQSSGSFEQNEQRKKLYLMDELDRATRLSKFNSYTANQDLNRVIYDKIFSGIISTNNASVSISMIKNDLKNNEKHNENQFIDYLAIDKFNEIYAKSYKNTIKFFNEKCHSSSKLNLNNSEKKPNINYNLIEKIKNSGCYDNNLLKSQNFENTKYSNFFSSTNFGKFNDSIRFKSTSTSRFLMVDKAKKVYQPKKLVTIVTSEKDPINKFDV